MVLAQGGFPIPETHPAPVFNYCKLPTADWCESNGFFDISSIGRLSYLQIVNMFGGVKLVLPRECHVKGK